MAQTVITPGQVIQLEKSDDFQAMVKQFAKDHAVYLAGQDGRGTNTAGLSPNIWARHEMIGYRIMKNPFDERWRDWASQMLQFLKGQPVWDTDVPKTIQFLIDSGKMQQITLQTYALRASAEDFPQDPSVYAGA